MKQERLQKPVSKPATRRAEQDPQEGPAGHQEVREDVRKTWWPEG